MSILAVNPSHAPSDLFDVRAYPHAIALFTFLMACLLVSTLPTFSGKLMGERIPREMVPPILIGVAAVVGYLVTYTYPTLAAITVVYLALIPWSVARFRAKLALEPARAAVTAPGAPPVVPSVTIAPVDVPPTKH